MSAECSRSKEEWRGAYHGAWGFDAFSKLKPVFYRSRLNRFADAYPPYGAKARG